MWGLIAPLLVGGALITTPEGSAYLQPMGDGYTIWSQQGITTMRDYGGWQQIRTPEGTTNVIDMTPGVHPNLDPVIGPVLGPEVGGGE